MKSLEKLNLVELNSDELKNIEGGFMFTIAVCCFALGIWIGAQMGTNGAPQARR